MNEGNCQSCNKNFPYRLIHSGFSDIAYAYCDACGMTAIVGGWDDKNRPEGVHVALHSVITPDIESYLSTCQCGGSFKSTASPRCPHCLQPIDPEDAKTWLEKNAPGTAKGWRWQCDWTGVYAIIIDGRYEENNWKHN